TVELSELSLDALPPRSSGQNDLTDRVPPPDDVRNRTTLTNPIGVPRLSNPTLPPLSLPDSKRSSSAFAWIHPVVRRAVVTLGLGAIIGVPPAVFGVMWSARHRTRAALVAQPDPESAKAPVVVAAPAPAAPVVLGSTGSSETADPPPAPT